MRTVWAFLWTGLTVLSGLSLATPVEGKENPLLKAMTEELERSRENLRLEGFEGPYYLSYRVKDTETETVSARFGGLVTDAVDRVRNAYVEVRVGDYEMDNSLDKEGMSYGEMTLYQAESTLPLGDDIPSIRRALWLLTDQHYKQALTAYQRVRGASVYREKQTSGAFTKEDAQIDLSQEIRPTPSLKDWKQDVIRWSRLLVEGGKILDGTVDMNVDSEIRYFVSSDGAKVVTQKQLIGVHVYGVALDAKGNRIDYGKSFYAPSLEELPTREAVGREVIQVRTHLEALRDAPPLAPYTGPAILMPRAAGVLFHEAIGHRLEGHRQDDPEEGQTFAGQVGEAIIPSFLSVVDDPGQSSWEGTPLNGSYAFDDEGVRAQRVELVERGILRNFLMGRKPLPDMPHSNGHGRAQGNLVPVGRMGNLMIHAEGSVSLDELKKKLLAEVRAQGKPFGLLIGDVTGGSTNTMNYGYQAFKGGATQVYTLDANSGEMRLVRGVEIVGTPLSTLNKVVAASTNTGVFNGYCGAESGNVPVSTIAPALLLEEIETQRATRSPQRAPLLAPPDLETVK